MKQQVNLYHPAFRKRQAAFGATTMLRLSIVLLAGLGGFAISEMWRAHAAQSSLVTARAERDGLEAKIAGARTTFLQQAGDAALAERVREMEALLGAPPEVHALLKRDGFRGGHGYSDYFVGLARQSMPGLWLLGMEIGGAGEHIVLHGRSLAPERVPQYLQRLEREVALAGRTFQVFSMTRPPEKDAGEQGASGQSSPDAKLARYVAFTVRTESAKPSGEEVAP